MSKFRLPHSRNFRIFGPHFGNFGLRTPGPIDPAHVWVVHFITICVLGFTLVVIWIFKFYFRFNMAAANRVLHCFTRFYMVCVLHGCEVRFFNPSLSAQAARFKRSSSFHNNLSFRFYVGFYVVFKFYPRFNMAAAGLDRVLHGFIQFGCKVRFYLPLTNL